MFQSALLNMCSGNNKAPASPNYGPVEISTIRKKLFPRAVIILSFSSVLFYLTFFLFTRLVLASLVVLFFFFFWTTNVFIPTAFVKI